MRGYREPAPPPDPRFERYRRGAAHLYDGDDLAGNLVTRVDTCWTTEGPWWRRRHVRPVERVGWFITFEPGYPYAHSSGWDDGVDADVDDLDDDEFGWVGRTLRVEWLTGTEADDHVAQYGW